jgi:pimeloyl-ACP methyl ester carboxylesterase
MTREPAPTPENSTTVRSTWAVRLARIGLHTAFELGENAGGRLAARLFTTPRKHPRPPRERDILLTGHPFSVELTLRSPKWKAARRELAAWRWGQGPTVLLVHGWEGRGSQLGALIEPLVDAGMSVVTFDAPAHGDSDGRQLYLTDMADAISAVVAHTGPIHGLVAHSFGAAAALLAYHRDGIDAPRNVFIAPNVLIDDAVFRFTQFFELTGTERLALEDRLGRDSGIAPSLLALDRLVGDRDSALLVVHDDGDRDVPPIHGRRLAANWAGAKLIATDGLGHRRILRDPGVVAAAVELLTAGAPTTASDLRRAMLDGWVEAIDPSRFVAGAKGAA